MGASDRASHASSGLTEPGASLPLTTAPATPPYRFLLAWAVGWAVAGALVGGGIAFTLERLGPGRLAIGVEHDAVDPLARIVKARFAMLLQRLGALCPLLKRVIGRPFKRVDRLYR